MWFYNAPGLAPINIRIQHPYPVSFSVLFQCFQIVKTHRLLVEDTDEELQRMIVFQPGRLVGRHSEGEGV